MIEKINWRTIEGGSMEDLVRETEEGNDYEIFVEEDI